MASESEAVLAVHRSLAALPRGRWLLAVSGGRDSMVLLDAMARARTNEIVAVATFDHGTGVAATRAAGLVERTALAMQLPVVRGAHAADSRTRARGGTEAKWREARWRFLNGWADELGAVVMTAHTRDDQIETVVLRLLRDTGVRGLAGMLAPSEVRRPLIEVPRTTVATYAEGRTLAFVEDPSNVSRTHARNRVRWELLPALEAARPGFRAWCWDVSERAAAWRVALAEFVDAALAPSSLSGGTLVVRADAVRALGAPEWAVLWPELAGRAGVAMDRRGIERASAWAPSALVGSGIQLSGGADIARTASTFVVRGEPASYI